MFLKWQRLENPSRGSKHVQQPFFGSRNTMFAFHYKPAKKPSSYDKRRYTFTGKIAGIPSFPTTTWRNHSKVNKANHDKIRHRIGMYVRLWGTHHQQQEFAKWWKKFQKSQSLHGDGPSITWRLAAETFQVSIWNVWNVIQKSNNKELSENGLSRTNVT